MRRVGVAMRVLLALGAVSAGGCFGSGTTTFPPGTEPWEMNRATLPPAQAGNAYPEQLVYAETTWNVPGGRRGVLSVHARGYVQAPLATVFAAVRDPQVGRDARDSDGFRVLGYDSEPMYRWSYQTYVHVTQVVVLEWNLNWRHAVVSGTEQNPTATASRWQKTSGTNAIPTLEGSVVLLPVEGHPEVTEVQYQYHLDAPFPNYNALEIYLDAVYQRLLDRSHGRALDPNDCMNCPAVPANYGP